MDLHLEWSTYGPKERLAAVKYHEILVLSLLVSEWGEGERRGVGQDRNTSTCRLPGRWKLHRSYEEALV